jgi:hypothetical protein
MLICMTNISITTNDEQKCFQSNKNYHLCQKFDFFFIEMIFLNGWND